MRYLVYNLEATEQSRKYWTPHYLVLKIHNQRQICVIDVFPYQWVNQRNSTFKPVLSKILAWNPPTFEGYRREIMRSSIMNYITRNNIVAHHNIDFKVEETLAEVSIFTHRAISIFVMFVILFFSALVILGLFLPFL